MILFIKAFKMTNVQLTQLTTAESSEIVCGNPATSRRPYYIRSVERPHHGGTPTRSLRHTLGGREDGLRRRGIHSVRGDVTRGVGLILLSFRLKDLTLRLEE